MSERIADTGRDLEANMCLHVFEYFHRRPEEHYMHAYTSINHVDNADEQLNTDI